MKKASSVFVFLLVIFSNTCFADTLKLKNGRVFNGSLKQINANEVSFDVQVGSSTGTLRFRKNEIESINDFSIEEAIAKLSVSEKVTSEDKMQMSLPSTDAQVYIDRGESYGKAGKLDQAITEFNKALEISPNNAAAFNDRGMVYSLKGNLDEALSDYNKAIELNPSFAMAYNNRGFLYGKDKREFDLAIADLTKAIEINPKLIIAYLNRGMAYSFKNEFDKAIANYTEVIEINPNVSDVYYGRAAAYYYKAEYEKAWKDVHKVQSIGGSVPEQFIVDLRAKMEEPKSTKPLREKGFNVGFWNKGVASGLFPGRFVYSVGINDEKKAVDSPADLVELFLEQDKTVQENGIWLVVTNPLAYSAEEKEMISKLEELCKQNKIILFKARGMNLSNWERIN